MVLLMMAVPAGAELYKSCAYLQVEVQPGSGWAICNTSCRTGGADRTNWQRATFSQSVGGIDCKVGFNKPSDPQKKYCQYFYRVKQNYCLLAAGNIYVTLSTVGLPGPPYTRKSEDVMNYKINRGSYNERAGQVIFYPKKK